MTILAFDSTAKAASVALLRDGRCLGSFCTDNGMTHSEQLLPMAEALLRSAHLTFADVDTYACTVGPGSFTGVRIGVSLLKGLAFDGDLPCVGLSTLETLAENLRGLSGLLCPVMDARRGQVYNALFRAQNGKVERLCEDRALSIEDLEADLQSTRLPGEALWLCGDGYDLVREAFTAAHVPCEDTPPRLRPQDAAAVARLAYSRAQAGETISSRVLSPLYLRSPQAERERLQKQVQTEENTHGKA